MKFFRHMPKCLIRWGLLLMTTSRQWLLVKRVLESLQKDNDRRVTDAKKSSRRHRRLKKMLNARLLKKKPRRKLTKKPRKPLKKPKRNAWRNWQRKTKCRIISKILWRASSREESFRWSKNQGTWRVQETRWDLDSEEHRPSQDLQRTDGGAKQDH